MVESEDPYTGDRQHICKAFFVFVAKPSDGGKVIDAYVHVCTHIRTHFPCRMHTSNDHMTSLVDKI